jgi:hypothetical protein
LTAGFLSYPIGAKLIAKQSKHVPRRTKTGNPLYTAPIAAFPRAIQGAPDFSPVIHHRVRRVALASCACLRFKVTHYPTLR